MPLRSRRASSSTPAWRWRPAARSAKAGTATCGCVSPSPSRCSPTRLHGCCTSWLPVRRNRHVPENLPASVRTAPPHREVASADLAAVRECGRGLAPLVHELPLLDGAGARHAARLGMSQHAAARLEMRLDGGTSLLALSGRSAVERIVAVGCGDGSHVSRLHAVDPRLIAGVDIAPRTGVDR